MPEKIFQVVIYDDEDKKLRELAEKEDRSMSWIIRSLINREYANVVAGQESNQTISTTDRG